jgi:hypothetical protein
MLSPPDLVVPVLRGILSWDVPLLTCPDVSLFDFFCSTFGCSSIFNGSGFLKTCFGGGGGAGGGGRGVGLGIEGVELPPPKHIVNSPIVIE